MALSKKQLEAILAVIQSRYLSFTYEALGPRALTEDEIKTLQRTGLLRSGTRHMVADSMALGRLVALLPPTVRKEVTYETLLRHVQSQPIPLTDVENKAIEYATEHAGEYIKGIKDMVMRDVKASTSRASMTALNAVKQGVSESIANRETISELKTKLFDAIDNRTRDWQRVAHTEINTAVQYGIQSEIMEKSTDGADQVVFKRPASNACVHCKRVYLSSDGMTPRVFKLGDLAETNIGLKAASWKAVVGSTHPWCNCQLQVIPEGYDFKKMKTVIEPFKYGGHQYKRGEVIDDNDYDSLDKDAKSKVGFDAILSFTGKTAEPSVEKSFALSHGTDDCTCDHD